MGFTPWFHAGDVLIFVPSWCVCISLIQVTQPSDRKHNNSKDVLRKPCHPGKHFFLNQHHYGMLTNVWWVQTYQYWMFIKHAMFPFLSENILKQGVLKPKAMRGKITRDFSYGLDYFQSDLIWFLKTHNKTMPSWQKGRRVSMCYSRRHKQTMYVVI